MVWAYRSDINLVGNSFDVQTGKWLVAMAGIGAGVDSFYEELICFTKYLFKAYVLFGEHSYGSIFSDAYKAILQHIRDVDGYLYKQVNMENGGLMATWIDSLAAFFPGLQATKDPHYLEVGEIILNDLEATARVPCGFASIHDISTGRHEDRMESFFLSETLKYLYLLFDEDNFVNKLDDNFVITTEGHFLPLPRKYMTDPQVPNWVCPNTQSTHFPGWLLRKGPLLPPAEVAAIDRLVGYIDPEDWSGVCEAFSAYTPGSALIQSHEVKVEPKDGSPYEKANITRTFESVIVDNLAGVTLSLRLDGPADGFIIWKVNDVEMDPGQVLQVPRDGVTAIVGNVEDDIRDDAEVADMHEHAHLTAFVALPDGDEAEVEVNASPAAFGPKLLWGEILEGTLAVLSEDPTREVSGPFSLMDVPLTGCEMYSEVQREHVSGRFVLVSRGGCMFVEKAMLAEQAGAIGVIVVNHDNHIFQMASAGKSDSDPLDAPGRVDGVDVIGIPAVLVTQYAGKKLADEARVQQESGGMGLRLVGRMGVTAVGRTGINLQFSGRPIKNLQVHKRLKGGYLDSRPTWWDEEVADVRGLGVKGWRRGEEESVAG
ncbi:alpha mannosidase-like protein [Rhizophlyctis rosea]|nr:alpha mannosidase-like protein [Rhizophlyctis rosea]